MFDDDTDLPLPSMPMPSSSTSHPTWTTIYPIYFDAKRPFNTCRRVPLSAAVQWPVSVDIANAASRLGWRVSHEQGKTHPRDWANPGRVKIVRPAGMTSACARAFCSSWCAEGADERDWAEKQALMRISTALKPLAGTAKKLPPHSPELETGMLVDAISAEEVPQPAAPGALPFPLPHSIYPFLDLS